MVFGNSVDVKFDAFSGYMFVANNEKELTDFIKLPNGAQHVFKKSGVINSSQIRTIKA